MVKLNSQNLESRGLRGCRRRGSRGIGSLRIITMWTLMVVGLELIASVGPAAGWESYSAARSHSHQRVYSGPLPSEVPGGAGPTGEEPGSGISSGGFRKNVTTSVYSHASRYSSSYDGRELKGGGNRSGQGFGAGGVGGVGAAYNGSVPEEEPCSEKGGCAYNGMEMEVLKSISLAKIRQDILRKLKLDEHRLPNVSGKNFHMADYLSEMVDMQGDSPRDDFDDEQATTQTIIAFSKIQPLKVNAKESKEIYYFTFSDKLTNMRIENAILYIQVNISASHQPSYSGMHHRHHHDVKKHSNFTIKISQHVPQKKGESLMQIDYGYFKPTFRVSDDIHESGGAHRYETTRWIMIDVKDEIGKWVSNSPPSASKRIGLIIEAINPNKDVSKEVVILGSSDLEHLSASNVNNNPFIKLNLKEKTRSRHTRDVGMVCEENSPEKRCCRYPLTVDFEEFGWDFIIAPKRYDANYCSGECPPAYLQAYPHNHIVQQALPSGVGGPCCAARMIVDRCGCT